MHDSTPDEHGVAELEEARLPYGTEWPPSLAAVSTDFPNDDSAPSWLGGWS